MRFLHGFRQTGQWEGVRGGFQISDQRVVYIARADRGAQSLHEAPHGFQFVPIRIDPTPLAPEGFLGHGLLFLNLLFQPRLRHDGVRKLEQFGRLLWRLASLAQRTNLRTRTAVIANDKLVPLLPVLHEGGACNQHIAAPRLGDQRGFMLRFQRGMIAAHFQQLI